MSTPPSGYPTIIIDPPWQYSNAGAHGAAEFHYPTMTIAELRALPVGQLAAPDAVLLLWATWPLLPEALTLLPAWGFEYVTGMPWVKLQGDPERDLWGEVRYTPQYGAGFWVRGCTEPILIARRGKARPGDMGNFVGLVSQNFGHSRKPENLYQYAEAHAGPYLELFARRARPGWAIWGNEVASTIAVVTP